MTDMVCFNELSIQPLCQTEAEADKRLKNFVALLKEVKRHTKITKIRHEKDLTSIPLSNGITVQDYCNKNIRSAEAIIVLSMFVHPQVDTEKDDSILQNYLDTETELLIDEKTSVPADGFNAAYCQSTFCVGFDSDSIWNNDFFDLKITSNGKSRAVRWGCISSLSFYNDPNENAKRQPEFDKWLQTIRPITLLPSSISPDKKKINLRDDHGKDKLEAHAKLLCNHPNVDGVLTSLAFKRHSKNYISNITDDGLVDITLWWEDDGYSMRVKTTGRNFAETKKIAQILKDKYEK